MAVHNVRIRKSIVLSAASALALSLAVAAPGRAQENVKTFDIPSQSLADALTAYSRQSDVIVFAPAALTKDKVANPVSGAMAPEEALNLILTGSGLKLQETASGAYTITLASAGARPSDPAPFRIAQTNRGQSTSATAVSVEPTDEERDRDQIIVTGTNIRGANPKSSPVVVVDSLELQQSGFATIADYFEFLPQNFAEIGSDRGFNTRPGEGPAVNLRGLGANETLVLINGQRVTSSTTFGSFVDLSLIPVTAVERIEILLDGASAVYGSDAVAGVLNIILKSGVDGLMLNARYGTVTDGGLEEYRASATGGLNWRSGGVTISYEFFDRSPLRSADRDFVRQSVDFDLIPGETRHNVSASLKQKITDDIDLRIDSLISIDESFDDRSNEVFNETWSSKSRFYWFNAGVSGSYLGFDYDLNGSFSSRSNDNPYFRETIGTTSRVNREFKNDTSVYAADLRISRPLLALPGGDALVGFGGGIRGQTVQLQTLDQPGDVEVFFIDPDRDVAHAYGEMILPLIGPENNIPLAREFEINASVRHEDFSDVGSSTNPKVGFVWAPKAWFSIKGSYGTSFRAPELRQVNGLPTAAVFDISAFGVADPFPELGDNIVLNLTGPNPDLGPQESRSYSIGADLTPPVFEDLTFTVNYFDINYDGRIGDPTTVIGFPGVYNDPRVVDFFTVSPAASDIQAIVEGAGITGSLVPGVDLDDPSTYDPINLIFDSRNRNLSRSVARGLDFQIAYRKETPVGNVTFDFNSVYLLDNAFSVIEGDALTDNVDTLANPVDFQFRAGMGYNRGDFSGNVFVNYTDDYENNQTAVPERINAWATVDLSLAYAFQASRGALQGMSARFSMQNIFDADPPFAEQVIPGSAGVVYEFDTANASPLGRFIAFEISRQF